MSRDIEDLPLEWIFSHAKLARLKKEADAEKLPVLFDKILELLVSASEKFEALTSERDQLAAQVTELNEFISKRVLPHLEVLSNDYPQCLGIDCTITDAKELVKAPPTKNLDDIRAKAVINFAEVIRGAYQSGFVTAGLNVYDVYQSARNHVKDNYGYDTTAWNDADAQDLRDNSDKE